MKGDYSLSYLKNKKNIKVFLKKTALKWISNFSDIKFPYETRISLFNRILSIRITKLMHFVA